MWAIMYRNYLLWCRKIPIFIGFHVFVPTIMLFAMSHGLNDAMEGHGYQNYMAYVTAGFIFYAATANAFFGSVYGLYERLVVKNLYQSYFVAGISSGQIVLGEALWLCLRACVAALLLQVVAWGAFGLPWLLDGVLPFALLLLTGFCVAMLGFFLSSFASNYDEVAYVEALLTPMLIFSGVFIPLAAFPEWVGYISLLSPLFHGLELLRAGFDINHLLVLGVTTVITFGIAVMRVRGRLIC